MTIHKKSGMEWLHRLFGPEGAASVAQAYHQQLSPTHQQGWLILSDLAAYCQVRSTSFSTDPYQTAFNEGARDVFLHIAEMLGITPDDLILPRRDN
jgi:hypothetical protein